jgi:hypothetical protein
LELARQLAEIGQAFLPASQKVERLRKREEEQVKKNTLVLLSLEFAPQSAEIGHASLPASQREERLRTREEEHACFAVVGTIPQPLEIANASINLHHREKKD